jgi:integration host factor subunit beta
MTKGELIERLTTEAGITLLVVELAFERMAAALVRGDRNEVRGFGVLTVKDYEEYEGRNPKTGEQIQVKGKRLPAVRGCPPWS